MDRVEARAVAQQVLDGLLDEGYERLTSLLDESRWSDHVGPSGAVYAVKAYAIPDVGDDIRVVAGATDGIASRFGWTSLATADDIIGPAARSAEG